MFMLIHWKNFGNIYMNRLFFLLLVFTSTFKLNAQVDVFKLLDRDQYLAKVKLVDEFFCRFNGEELRNDLGDKYSDHESNILLLFDLAKYKSKNDSNFIAAKDFAHYVVSNNTKLNFEDSLWYAKIKCHGKFAQKNITFNMKLCVEPRDSIMYRWAICDVEGDLFNTSKDKPHNELFIMPNENEQFFMSIRKLTTESYKFIDDYAKNSYKTDRLSTFLALVRMNLLKIDAVTDVEFTFLQVPDYSFTIKYFNRETKNSGWLIDSFKRITPEEKDIIIKTVR